jgi:hypothetical protein
MSSYRIHTSGIRAAVISDVLSAKTDVPEADQTQLTAERAAILAEIKALPEKLTHIRVFAFGDSFPDHSSSRREISGYVAPLDSTPLPESAAVPKTPDAKP